MDCNSVKISNNDMLYSKVYSKFEGKSVEKISNVIPHENKAINSISEEKVIRSIEEANKRLLGTNTEMHMSVHEETKKINIKIIDKETNDIIIEYPPEKLLDIFAKMIELSGLIVDEKR